MINKIEKAMEYIDKVFSELGKEKIEYINDNYGIEDLGCPHSPKSLPKDCCAVYIFIYKDKILKIGKVNKNSNPRFRYQHYKPESAKSTLAKSICNDNNFFVKGINETNVKDWMLNNLQRINIIVKSDDKGVESNDKAVISLIESMLHYMFRPKYEGDI